MQEKRAEWKEVTEEIPKEKLIFLDGSGVNTNLVRRYGRTVGKTRVVDHASFSTPRNTTVLTAIRQDGQFASMTFEGVRQKNVLENIWKPSFCRPFTRATMSSWIISGHTTAILWGN